VTSNLRRLSTHRRRGSDTITVEMLVGDREWTATVRSPKESGFPGDTTDFLDRMGWIQQYVLPPLYRNTVHWTCACQDGPCPPCRLRGLHGSCYARSAIADNGLPYPETEVWDRDGLPIYRDGSPVRVWLADRTCRFQCPCSCRTAA